MLASEGLFLFVSEKSEGPVLFSVTMRRQTAIERPPGREDVCLVFSMHLFQA